MNTKTASTVTHQVPPPVKEKISAKEFGEKRLAFMVARIEQFALRRNLTASEVDDVVNKPGGYAEIDKEVDEHLHSSNCPDPTQYEII